MVGCVIVRDGAVVGEGWHQRAGGPHAEIFALRQAGVRARGATAYVTLEPCAHHGRTPPCALALIEAGVARVVAAMRDPFPQVNGGGFDLLRAAGIAVQSGLMELQARELNHGFFSRIERGRPWLRPKLRHEPGRPHRHGRWRIEVDQPGRLRAPMYSAGARAPEPSSPVPVPCSPTIPR